jgi:large subunit ribosomal protein L29
MAATTTKKAKAPKAQDKSALGASELRKDLAAALDKRAKMKFAHGVTPLKNPLELRHIRREIARLKTHLRTKEAAK